jgi:sortase family protein
MTNGRLQRALVVAGIVAVGAGVILLQTPPEVVASRDAGLVPTAPTPAEGASRAPSIPARDPPVRLAVRKQTPAVGIPVELRVDGRSARIVPARTGQDGMLALPDSPHVVAWWSGGTWVGARQGTVVLAGHIDTAREGAGILAGLAELPIGTSLVVRDDRGVKHGYVLRARRSYPKQDLPRELFRGDGQPRLVLITCGGRFDERNLHYDQNIVGYAVPAS